MDFLGALAANVGFIAFSAIGAALAAYLAYYMVRPQRF